MRRDDLEIGGPTRTRTWDQWIHILTVFQPCADYLISLASANAALGSGTLWPVIKNTRGSFSKATRSQVVSAPSDSVLSAWLRIAGCRERQLRFP